MSSFASSIRRPEHTGENRCWPCTVVNVALVGAGATALALLASPAVGVAGAVVGLAAVWLRGYLVPGTPRFAPRLVAAVPGGERLFDRSDATDAPHATADTDPDTATPPAVGGSIADDGAFETGSDLLERLVEAGVLEVDGEAVAPTPRRPRLRVPPVAGPGTSRC